VLDIVKILLVTISYVSYNIMYLGLAHIFFIIVHYKYITPCVFYTQGELLLADTMSEKLFLILFIQHSLLLNKIQRLNLKS